MKLPAVLDDIWSKFISLRKKSLSFPPNVFCTRCGFEWHDARFAAERKLPYRCISCYVRSVAPKPSLKESIVSSARAKMKRREKENKGKSKLK